MCINSNFILIDVIFFHYYDAFLQNNTKLVDVHVIGFFFFLFKFFKFFYTSFCSIIVYEIRNELDGVKKEEERSYIIIVYVSKIKKNKMFLRM
jgi:hypothetical protein